MRAGKYNMTCEQGATFRRNIFIEHPSPSASAQGTYEDFNLTDYQARMHVRRTIDSSAILLELTTQNGALTINPAEAINHIYINVAASVTASVSTSGVYDLEVVDGEGVVYRVLEGLFTVNPEVTR